MNPPAFLTTLLCVATILLLCSWEIPIDNAEEVLKKNKVSYVQLRFCDGSACFVVDNRYDKRGNHIYSHLLRTGSGWLGIYNEKDQLIKAGWGIWEEKAKTEWHTDYEYDNCGNVSRELSYYEGDSTYYHYEYTYDGDCKMVLERKTDPEIKLVIENIYYPDGRPVKRVRYQPDSLPKVLRTWEYNSAGLPVKETSTGGVETLEYNDKGLLVKSSSVNSKGEYRQRLFTYDSLCRLIHVVEPGDEIQMIFGTKTDTVQTTDYSYDSAGRLKRHRQYFGDPCMGGYYLDLVYEYLPNGLLKGAHWYGKEKEGLVVEYVYEYHRKK